MKKALFGALLALAATAAHASTAQDVESSTVVQGSIVVAKDGTVQTAVVDDVKKYGQPIADMVRRTALQWRFQPVLRDGAPVLAKASMHVRVILKRISAGNYSARIKGPRSATTTRTIPARCTMPRASSGSRPGIRRRQSGLACRARCTWHCTWIAAAG